MTPDNGPDGDLIREVYAQFGLTYYLAEVLHRGLSNIYVVVPFDGPDGITAPRVDERMAQAFDLTLGQLVAALDSWLNDELRKSLAAVVERRNFLAHHFWYERAHMLLTEDGIADLIGELREHAAAFERATMETDSHFSKHQSALGLATPELLERAMADVVAGQDAMPFQTQRQLRKQETLVHVWDVAITADASTLVFELNDGSLWQLCDVGLGWTRYAERGQHWTENDQFRPHLPSRINPRPGASGSWSYEFALRGRAAFVVRLRSGSNHRGFTWAIRKTPSPAKEEP